MLPDDNKVASPPPIEDENEQDEGEDDHDSDEGGGEEEGAPFRDNHNNNNNNNKLRDNGDDKFGKDGIQSKKSLVLPPLPPRPPPKTVAARRVRFALDSEGRPEMESHPIHAPVPAGSRSRPTSFPTSIIRRRSDGSDVPLDSNPTPGSQIRDSEDEDPWQTSWDRGNGQRMLSWSQGSTSASTTSSCPTPSRSTRPPLDEALFQMLHHHSTTGAVRSRPAFDPLQEGDSPSKGLRNVDGTGYNDGNGDRPRRGHGRSFSSPLLNRRGLLEIDRWFMEPSTASIVAEDTLSGGRDHRGRIGEGGSRPPIVRPLVVHERESHAIQVPSTSDNLSTRTTDTNTKSGTQAATATAASTTHPQQHQGRPGAGDGNSFVKGHRRSAPLFSPTESTPSPIATALTYAQKLDLDMDSDDSDSEPCVDDVKEPQDRQETMKDNDNEHQTDSDGSIVEEEVVLDYFYFRQLTEAHGGSSTGGSSSHGPLGADFPPAPPPFLPMPCDLVPVSTTKPTMSLATTETATDSNDLRENTDRKKKKFFKSARSRFAKGFHALGKVFRHPSSPKSTPTAAFNPSPSSSSTSTQPSSSSSTESTSIGWSPRSARRSRTRTDSSSSRREARRLLVDTNLSSKREENVNGSSKDQQEGSASSALPLLQLITDTRASQARHSLGSSARPISATPIADAHARHVFVDRPLSMCNPEVHRNPPPPSNGGIAISSTVSILPPPPVVREHVRTHARSASSSSRGDWFQRWRSSLKPSKRHSTA